MRGATGSSFLPFFHHIKTWEGFHLISQLVELWTLNNPISKTLISAGLCRQGLFGPPTRDGHVSHGCEHMHMCVGAYMSACTHISGGRRNVHKHAEILSISGHHLYLLPEDNGADSGHGSWVGTAVRSPDVTTEVSLSTHTHTKTKYLEGPCP